jgi:hypothetical protein
VGGVQLAVCSGLAFAAHCQLQTATFLRRNRHSDNAGERNTLNLPVFPNHYNLPVFNSHAAHAAHVAIDERPVVCLD